MDVQREHDTKRMAYLMWQLNQSRGPMVTFGKEEAEAASSHAKSQSDGRDRDSRRRDRDAALSEQRRVSEAYTQSCPTCILPVPPPHGLRKSYDASFARPHNELDRSSLHHFVFVPNVAVSRLVVSLAALEMTETALQMTETAT